MFNLQFNAVDKSSTVMKVVGNPIPTSPASSILLAHKIIIESNIFYKEVSFQIIKSKLEKNTQKKEYKSINAHL